MTLEEQLACAVERIKEIRDRDLPVRSDAYNLALDVIYSWTDGCFGEPLPPT